MTVSTTTNRYSYAGNGTTTAFSYPSKFLANGDLVVLLVDDEGVSTTQTLTTHYTVTGAGVAGGGTVTMVTAPASGETLVIYNDPGITQAMDLVENDPLPAEELEDAFDKLTIICQRIRDLLNRAVRFSDTDISGASTTLPTPAAGEYLRWNTDGDALENADAVYDNGNFLASGTGAVSRTVDSKLGDTVSVKDFGAVGDGTTDDTDAIQAAIDRLSTSAPYGGTVYFPPGIYAFSATLDFDETIGVTLEGAGSGTGGAVSASALKFTGTGSGDAISAEGTHGFTLRNLMIYPSSASFTGNLVNLCGNATRDTALAVVEGCNLGNSSLPNATRLVYVNKAIEVTFLRTNFFGGQYQLVGRDVSDYANVIKVRDCQFVNYSTAAAANGGQAWLFDGCTFENGASGQPAAFVNVTGAACAGLVFRSCWFGDASATGTWIDLGGSNGLEVSGCYFGGSASVAVVGIDLDLVNGIEIHSNQFDQLDKGVDFTGVCDGVKLSANRFDSCDTNVNGKSNATNADFAGNSPTVDEQTLSTDGYKKFADGMVVQWGTAVISSGTSVAVNFPVTFGTLYSITLGVTDPSVGTIAAYYSSETASGFTANISTGTASVSWIAVGQGE